MPTPSQAITPETLKKRIQEERETLHPLTVLLVDDDPLILEYTFKILNRSVAKLFKAETGEKALEIAKKVHPDIVITDIVMPGMNGLMLIETMRTILPHTVYLVASAFHDVDLFKEAIRLKVRRFFIKPIEFDEVQDVINEIADEKKRHIEYERKERLLRDYRTAIDISSLVFSANPTGSITYANERLYDTLGKTSDTLIGFPLNLLFPNDALAIFDALAQHKIWYGEVVCPKNNAQVVWLEMTIVPMCDAHGNIHELLGIAYDISQAKKTQEELSDIITSKVALLRQQEEAMLSQSRLAAMGEMIGNIAHQWRQPLQAISLTLLNLKMAIMPLNKNDIATQAVAEGIKDIGDYVKFLNTTIEDFRNFFSPDKEHVLFKISEPINKAKQIVLKSFESAGISLIVTCPYKETRSCETCEGVIVDGYPHEFAQVLLNLFSNAKDVFKERNTPNPCIIIDYSLRNDKIIITVNDNGGGIPAHVLPKIFDPYYTTKHQSQGTGIGLYMSKTIIEKHHNGQITAHNTSEGACFTIRLLAKLNTSGVDSAKRE